MFRSALIVNTVASLSLCAFISWHLFGVGEGPLALGLSVFNAIALSMIGVGLLSAILATFGRGCPRALLLANGVLIAFLWWLFVGMGV